jgi:hypothetical protein
MIEPRGSCQACGESDSVLSSVLSQASSRRIRSRLPRAWCLGLGDHTDWVRLYGTSMEMLARSVPGVEDIVAQKSVVRIQDWRPMGKSRLGISGSSAAVKSFP